MQNKFVSVTVVVVVVSGDLA